MRFPNKKMSFWVWLLAVFMTAILGGHDAQARDKRGTSLPRKVVLVDPKGSAIPVKQGSGPFADGLWHMTFGTQVDARGCSTIEQASLADDDKPLYVCRAGDDDRFHVMHGSEVGHAYIQIRGLVVKNGKVEYLAQADDGTWWDVSGQNKTPASPPSIIGARPYSRGYAPSAERDEDLSMPILPEKNACGVRVNGPQYILANGDPLVSLRDDDTGKHYVCWGQEKGPQYKRISDLDFVGGHVRYIAETDDGLLHLVKGRQIGKGYADVSGVTYDADRTVYLGQDQGGKWHLVQDATEGQAFDEVGLLHYSFRSRKPMFAARRSASQGQPRL